MKKPFKEVPFSDESEWHAIRLTGIGGSEAAAACGVSPWKSRVRLYLDKTTERDENFDEATLENFEWGHRSEDMIAAKFAESHPEITVEKGGMYRSGEYEYMLANPDRLLFSGGKLFGILEIKTAGAGNEEKWEGCEHGVPDQYYLQVQHYLAVMGVDVAYVAVLFGGRRYREVRVDRNQNIINILIDDERDFWGHVTRREPPRVDEATTADDMGRAYQLEHSEVVEATPNDLDILAAREAAKGRIAELEKEVAKYDNAIRERIGTASGLSAPGWSVSWNEQRRAAVDVSAMSDEDREKYKKEVIVRSLRFYKNKK